MAVAAWTYILKCADGSFYIGWTNDLPRRLAAHNAGKGARYTRGRGPVQPVYWEEFDEFRAAQRREWQLKQLSRKEKECLVSRFAQERRGQEGAWPWEEHSAKTSVPDCG